MINMQISFSIRYLTHNIQHIIYHMDDLCDTEIICIHSFNFDFLSVHRKLFYISTYDVYFLFLFSFFLLTFHYLLEYHALASSWLPPKLIENKIFKSRALVILAQGVYKLVGVQKMIVHYSHICLPNVSFDFTFIQQMLIEHL